MFTGRFLRSCMRFKDASEMFRGVLGESREVLVEFQAIQRGFRGLSERDVKYISGGSSLCSAFSFSGFHRFHRVSEGFFGNFKGLSRQFTGVLGLFRWYSAEYQSSFIEFQESGFRCINAFPHFREFQAESGRFHGVSGNFRVIQEMSEGFQNTRSTFHGFDLGIDTGRSQLFLLTHLFLINTKKRGMKWGQCSPVS